MRHQRIPFMVLLLLFVIGSNAIKGQTSSGFTASERQVLIQRNFPLLSSIEAHPFVLERLLADPELSGLGHEQQRALTKGLAKFSDSTEGVIGAGLIWDSIQVNEIGAALSRLYQHHPKEIAKVVQGLKRSQAYALSDALSDTLFLKKAWESVAGGINYILRTYYLGGKPTYGKIDGMTIRLTTDTIKNKIGDSLQYWLKNGQHAPFYRLSLNAALLALELNQRDEAARYLPIERGMNASPFAKIKTVPFKDYTYSCILVPGLGPEKEGERLTDGGKQRCRMALASFKKGTAPFLLVSGGHVHPIKTPFCEAIEMKKFMVDSLGVPDSCVIIDPHARHTTTNLRNATRIIRTLGMPFDQPVLIITDTAQSAYINKGMRKVALRDLGYLPYTGLKQLTGTETSFIPNIQSLQVNPKDPLDP